MNKRVMGLLITFTLLLTRPLMAEDSVEVLKQQVWDTELAFAQTMAERDHEAFTSFLAEDAVFMGGKRVNRGKPMIAESWKKLFQKEKPPFAWKPERVEVLDDGTLALSTGPVWDDLGRFQTYTSIWKRQEDGSWKVIFDKGDKYCPDEKNK